MKSRIFRLCLLSLAAALLAACNDGGTGGSGAVVSSCPEKGPYACKTGATEPLYTFQWALRYADSYFKDFPDAFGGGADLNVEPVHRLGIKGRGVNVLVLDTGTDLHNEDLAPNADMAMSWNVTTGQADPYPDMSNRDNAHGTLVAGMIAAAQNGKGVMGIAPQVTLGASNLLDDFENRIFEAYGGASWSSKVDVINASYAGNTRALAYDSPRSTEVHAIAVRGLKQLRDGKGVVFVKGAGNDFNEGPCVGKRVYNCINPVNGMEALEPNTILVAALNALGVRASYSSAGPTVWVTGLGGEYGHEGHYGEGGGPSDGPTIFSTDVRGCVDGFSYTGARTPFMRGQTIRDGVPDNPDCDYAYMSGTSSATPTISGVVALVLEANPALSWRDVRDILRLSARKVDTNYLQRIPADGDQPYGARMDLTDNTLLAETGGAADIQAGSTRIAPNLGWQKNAAGHVYSDWYGFGVPDAEKAVSLAQDYARNPALDRSGDVTIRAFDSVMYWHKNSPPPAELAGVPVKVFDTPGGDDGFPYQVVSLIGTYAPAAGTVDEFQVRISGEGVCLGSLGIAVRSPAGTVSLLKLPNDHFIKDGESISTFTDYGLGSFAFYGEAAQGNWQIFTVAADPDSPPRLAVGACSSIGAGTPRDFSLHVQARVIAQ